MVGFFYNPNIHPAPEYQRRRRALIDYSTVAKAEIIYPAHFESEFLSAIGENKDQPKRCSLCWELRLKKTAQFARKNGFSAFSTTLLVSPYQDQGMLKEIGEKIAKEEGVPFYYEDFRPGFKKAHDEAKAKGVYCQKYCGCMYSYMERCRKSEEP